MQIWNLRHQHRIDSRDGALDVAGCQMVTPSLLDRHSQGHALSIDRKLNFPIADRTNEGAARANLHVDCLDRRSTQARVIELHPHQRVRIEQDRH